MTLIFWIVGGIALVAEAYHPVSTALRQAPALNRSTVVRIIKSSPQVIGILAALLCSFVFFHLAQALLGIILLIRAADVLISGAEVVARKAAIPPVVIGILIIGLGTSTPEFFVNVIAALKGTTDIALGNIVGSNTANIGLVIGIAGWIAGRIKIQKSIITAEMPAMMAATLLVLFQVMDFSPLVAGQPQAALSRQDGIVLLLGISLYLLYTFHVIADVPPNPTVRGEYESQYGKHDEVCAWLRPIAKILVGIGGLYLGGEFTVTGATTIAVGLGAGTLVVGVIIGVGTSLPELATAISSVLKDKPDLVIGNVVGSNIFNLLLILGATSVIKPIVVDPGILGHLGFLLVITVIFFIALGTKRELSRAEAMLLTALGVGYLAYSIVTG